jgi:hypothetical protein
MAEWNGPPTEIEPVLVNPVYGEPAEIKGGAGLLTNYAMMELSYFLPAGAPH